MNNPLAGRGIGWVIALLVLIVAILSFIVPVTVDHLAIWLIAALALAMLL